MADTKVTSSVFPQKSGVQLSNAQRAHAIEKLADILSKGYYSTNQLSKMLGLNRRTIEVYRPIVDKLIGEKKIDRNVIRNLQVKRTYNVIETIMKDLQEADTDLNDIEVRTKVKVPLYSALAKFSQHLALITGLNIETQVNVDQKQLVIIRAGENKKPVIDIADSEQVIDAALALNDSVPVEDEQQRDVQDIPQVS